MEVLFRTRGYILKIRLTKRVMRGKLEDVMRGSFCKTRGQGEGIERLRRRCHSCVWDQRDWRTAALQLGIWRDTVSEGGRT